MDLEDDTHMNNVIQTTTVQEVVNIPVMISPELIESLASSIVKNKRFEEEISGLIDSWMRENFDINDYSDDLDTYDLRNNIVDEVISTIKDRL